MSSKHQLSDHAVLATLLAAYDAGLEAASAGADVDGISSSPTSTAPNASADPARVSAMKVLQKIRDAPGHMGCDIGGTLVKMALALPIEEADHWIFPETFGNTGRAHHHLQLDLQSADGRRFVLRFVSGSTSQLELAVQHLGLRRKASAKDLLAGVPLDPEDRAHAAAPPGFDLAAAVRKVDESPPPFARSHSDWAGEVFTHSGRTIRRIATAGGGASKLAPLFRDALRVDMEPVKELSAVVDGLLLLAPRSAEAGGTGGSSYAKITSSGGPAADVFTILEDGSTQPLPWPEPLFPLILVNMGSGVSILRVGSANDSDYVRIGGTACGGGTFLGLARALTSARTFDEALALAEKGDAKRADKLVSDIYGEDGCKNLGLPGGLTASNFGKLCDDATEAECSERDLARSVLQMVTQQCVLLATAFAQREGCIDRVFFVGGFVDEPNIIARKAIAANLRALGGCAYFLRHSDFLGALGSLKCALRALEEGG